MSENERAVLALADDDARRARLCALAPTLPIAEAEAVIYACRAGDRDRGEAAFRFALDAIAKRAA